MITINYNDLKNDPLGQELLRLFNEYDEFFPIIRRIKGPLYVHSDISALEYFVFNCIALKDTIKYHVYILSLTLSTYGGSWKEYEYKRLIKNILYTYMQREPGSDSAYSNFLNKENLPW